jgi:bifunctional non-homologous end joining protein LigD
VATLTRSLERRDGKVYVDTLQNGHGRLIVAPFSVRPLPGAPVSTPLDWSEVESGLDPQRFTVDTVPGRMRARGTDPLIDVLALRVPLADVLSKLAASLDE